MWRRIPLLAVFAICAWGSQQFDVVVYGATAGGTIAAIAAAKEGIRVALVEPGRHAGGMISGGLGKTDMERQQQVIGGLAREFFERVGKHYGEPVSWRFEPSVAERTLLNWLKEAGVSVFFDQRITGIRKHRNRVIVLRTAAGDEFQAAVFIDSSYEGDLMQAAGVSYTIGRESRSRYGESLAGRQDILPGPHQFRAAVSPFGPDGKLLPFIQPQETIKSTGEGSRKFQSYCFRICLTRNADDRLPFPQPEHYDPARFALLANYIRSLGDSARLRDFLGIATLPNDKADVNSGGPVSTDLPGASWDYPDASYERRQEIWREHLTWAQGLLYFLANDSGVPAAVRAEMNQWGLPKDEFPDTDHWPHQLYIREGRRMLGEYVLTQRDLQGQRHKEDSIGMGGYNIDIREVQWLAHDVYYFPSVRQQVFVEGYLSMPVEPYDIPYRALLPKREECENLLVTSCISASSVAYASFRMEPQYMIAGQAAGIAAAQSVRTNTPLYRIDISALQRRLERQKQIIHLAAQ
ncbi:MAG TPA: FAD-dependent oxidoreductase [Bryobacteraceae bacterium]|nr:FAD-dependent oxidoreductase [Bryobacteraceae bacterium]